VDGEDSQRLALGSGMSHSIWLFVMALSGWFAGKSVGGKRLGAVGDILLGITGAQMVRFSLDVLRVSVDDTSALLFSVWGATALPYLVRFLMKPRDRRASARPSQTPGLAKPPVTISPFATPPNDGHVSRQDEGAECEARKGYLQAS